MSKIKLSVLILLVLASGIALYYWWYSQRLYPSTDDAYLQANIVTISSKVAGTVASVSVFNHQKVEAGEELFTLDDALLQAALEAAKAQLEIARQGVSSSSANVDSTKANLARAEATLTNAQAELARQQKLYEAGDVTKAALDNATAARDAAAAQRDAATAAMASATSQLGSAGDDNAGLRAARANLKQAEISLGYGAVIAPTTGWIANISMRPGQFVTPGQPLFSIVDDGEWWIDANFKETDLDRIRPGQPVTISIDMYSGMQLAGIVESIGAGSGAVFSLVPPENETGNWVKVTQRFPVRIRLSEKPDDEALQLRVGASVTVTVDTTGLDRKNNQLQ